MGTGAFAFGDRVLERRYQEFYLSTCVDRIRPFIYFLYVPIVGTIRMSMLVNSEFYGPRLGKAEVMLLQIRLSILVILLILLSKKWTIASNYRRGVFVFWLKRVTLILAAIQQMGRNSRDPQIMSTLVCFIFVGGLISPSFAEYISYSLVLTFLRPLYLSFSSSQSTSADEILNILYQNTLILALGASIIWTVHADHRRDWLRSRITVTDELLAQKKKTSKLAKQGNAKAKYAASTAESVGAVGTDEAQWDVVTDGCLEAADTQILAQARQVHCSCLLHIRIQQMRCSARIDVVNAPAWLPDVHPCAGAGGIDGAASGAAGRGTKVASLQHLHRRRPRRLRLSGPRPRAGAASTRSAGKGRQRV